MNSPAQDVKDMLQADSALGLTFAQNLFYGREPSEPADCVTVFDTPGFPLDLNIDGTERYWRPSIQIRIRNHSYNEGYALAESIVDSLHGRHGETWNDTTYTVIACSSGPALLDWDVNNNARFVANFNLQRR